jgi:hypothetical protein
MLHLICQPLIIQAAEDILEVEWHMAAGEADIVVGGEDKVFPLQKLF